MTVFMSSQRIINEEGRDVVRVYCSFCLEQYHDIDRRLLALSKNESTIIHTTEAALVDATVIAIEDAVTDPRWPMNIEISKL